MTTALTGVPPRASQIVNNSTYFDYLKGLAEHTEGFPLYPDAEPDKFFYSLPNGKGGSFVLDRNRNVMQIPKTSLRISVIGSLNGFNITDEDGSVYVFSVLENTESYIYSSAGTSPDAKSNPSPSSLYRNQHTAYYLSEIISSNGSDHIYFTYESETISSKDESYSETFGNKYPALSGPPQLPQINVHEYRWNGVIRASLTPRIKTIAFSNGKVEFTRISGRQDDPTASKLDEITIYNKNNSGGYVKLKSFKFNYSYYYNPGTYSPNSGFPQNQNTIYDRYRLRLDNIAIKDAASNPISSYTFSYNSTVLPPKTSCAQDWYGYYNGDTSNTTLVPPGVAFQDVGTGVQEVQVGEADRSSNEAFMKAGILEKITYPTRGYTVFDFESHKIIAEYSSEGAGTSAYAQGNTSNNLSVQTITIPNTNSAQYKPRSGNLFITIGPYSLDFPQPFVKIKNMSTGLEETYTNPDLDHFYSFSQPYDFQPGVTYQITASCYANMSYAMASITVSFTKLVHNPHLEPVGGLRIKSLKNYSSDNILAYEENYKYGLNESGAGDLLGISPANNSYYRAFAVYHGMSGCGVYSKGYQTYLGGPLFDQCLTQGSPVVYTEVVKYYGATSNNSGKTVYNYQIEQDERIKIKPLPAGQTLANNQGIIIINDAWKRGQLRKQSEFRKNPDGSTPLYTLVQEVENSYDKFITDTTFGLFAQTIYDRAIIIDAGPPCGGIRQFWDFNWAEYPLNTGYVQLKQTIKKDYDANGSGYVQTTINHTYDAVYRNIETKMTTVNSKLETIEKETKYPFNKSQLLTSITSAESTVLDDMVTKNMLFPIEEISRNNTAQMAIKKTSYEYVNATTIAPVNIKYKEQSSPIETRLQFTKYDANGNLVEQSKSNNVITSYLWGYGGTVPVVEVVGASYQTISGMVSSSVLSDVNPDPSTLRSQLNAIRTGLSSTNALVTTYTYNPMLGISSVTDPNNRTSYFEYDAFGRLQLIKDKDGNIVKTFEYKYKQ
jgi:YD repeat-containing protein